MQFAANFFLVSSLGAKIDDVSDDHREIDHELAFQVVEQQEGVVFSGVTFKYRLPFTFSFKA